MPIPDYQTLMLPLLRHASKADVLRLRDAYALLGDEFQLSEDERKHRLPSGSQATFDNRVGWARTYLVKAGLLESPKRGQFAITKRGRDVLVHPPAHIDVKFLRQFDEFNVFRSRNAPGSLPDPSDVLEIATPDDPEQTPEEVVESAYQNLRDDLAGDLLSAVMAAPASFFEQLVVDLLVRMGYGGTRKDAGQAIGQAHDGGIDGIIKEDRLGLDVVYIQAKRWQPGNTVSRPEIQKFAGALQGQRARKGVFITTSEFSKGARDFAAQIENKIVLINGTQLTDLMIDYDLGVSTVASYVIKRLDSDYFDA